MQFRNWLLNEGMGKYDMLLAKQAAYYDDFQKFVYDYSVKQLRPIYWHLTNDPNFTIDKEFVPWHANNPTGIRGHKREDPNDEPGHLFATSYNGGVKPHHFAGMFDLRALRTV